MSHERVCASGLTPSCVTHDVPPLAGLFVPTSPALLMHGLWPLAQDNRSDLVGVSDSILLNPSKAKPLMHEVDNLCCRPYNPPR